MKAIQFANPLEQPWMSIVAECQYREGCPQNLGRDVGLVPTRGQVFVPEHFEYPVDKRAPRPYNELRPKGVTVARLQSSTSACLVTHSMHGRDNNGPSLPFPQPYCVEGLSRPIYPVGLCLQIEPNGNVR